MTDWIHQELPKHLDARGDLAPPWARFPDYERYTIGWRMGSGESWLGFMHAFLDTLPTDRPTRLAYLKRHPPAPHSWARLVARILEPDAPRDDDDDDDDDDGTALCEALERLGLVESDVAYRTWRAQQGDAPDLRWLADFSPEEAARYHTRYFWFWSRFLQASRASVAGSAIPARWEPLREAIGGVMPPIEPERGLWSLAAMLCAGAVATPWQLGLTPADFQDSFEMDMGYGDAYRLWIMSVFDDAPHWERTLAKAPPPPEWHAWVEEHGFHGS